MRAQAARQQTLQDARNDGVQIKRLPLGIGIENRRIWELTRGLLEGFSGESLHIINFIMR